MTTRTKNVPQEFHQEQVIITKKKVQELVCGQHRLQQSKDERRDQIRVQET